MCKWRNTLNFFLSAWSYKAYATLSEEAATMYTLGLYLIVEQPSYGKTVLPYHYPEKRMLPEANDHSPWWNKYQLHYLWYNMEEKKKKKTHNPGILNAS